MVILSSTVEMPGGKGLSGYPYRRKMFSDTGHSRVQVGNSGLVETGMEMSLLGKVITQGTNFLRFERVF